MKKKIIVLMVLLLCAAGCGEKQGMTALKNHKNKLNESMKTYYSLALKRYKGEDFEAKVVSLVKVPDQENTYYYSIAMAPLYHQTICYKTIRLETSGDYKENHGFETENTLAEVLSDRKYYEAVYGVEDELSEYKALIMRGVIRFEKGQYSEKKCDSFVSNLVLKIDWGSGTDTIVMDHLSLEKEYDHRPYNAMMTAEEHVRYGLSSFGPIGVTAGN